MKYEDLNLPEEELANKGLLKGDDKYPCIMCKEPTNFIDYSEARICSEECMNEWNQWLNDHCGVNSPLE